MNYLQLLAEKTAPPGTERFKSGRLTDCNKHPNLVELLTAGLEAQVKRAPIIAQEQLIATVVEAADTTEVASRILHRRAD